MEKEEKIYKDIELRSEEVQEVMSEIPPWILRHGITTLFTIMVALLIGSWFFKYPDSVKAEITVTSLDPPASIIARSTGKIDKIFVINNEVVEYQTPLAVIQNPAKTEDMLELKRIMQVWNIEGYSDENVKKFFNKQSLSLGDIQTAYALFLNSLNDYQNYKTLNYYPKKIASQKEQLVTQKEYYNRILKQTPVMNELFRNSKSILNRDSILFAKNVISGNEYDISKNNFLQNKQAYLSFNASIKQSELQLIQGEESLLDMQQQATELERKYQLSLQNASEALSSQIKTWEQNYLLLSPIKGIVNQMGVWSINQNVNAGETIFTIIPTHQDTPKGKALLPVQGAGKVKVGQRVNARINNFPDQEFGYLVGRVASISSVPTSEEFYVVEIDFPDGIKTNYGRTLPITQQMLGTADIITDDLRLIERFFMPVKKMLKNNEIAKWIY